MTWRNNLQLKIRIIWNIFISGIDFLTESVDPQSEKRHLKTLAVEQQAESFNTRGTIWEVVRNARLSEFKRLIEDDPNLIEKRGPTGECPIHVLLVCGTDTHLEMAKYLIQRFPHTIIQAYNQPVKKIQTLYFFIFI